jgi:(S)-2-hydroxy-acid oxidase
MRNDFALPDNMTFPNILSEGGQEFALSEEEKANGPKAFGKIPMPGFNMR